MRLLVKFAMVVVAAGVLVELVVGQQGGFSGFGGLGALVGGNLRQDAASLLRNPGVKKELKLTEDQEAKVPAAIMEALAKVLDEEQLKRLKQIEVQSRGNAAFSDQAVQEALRLTDTQKSGIKDILLDADKEIQELQKEMQGAFGGGGGFGGFSGLQGIQGKFKTISKEANERCLDVLTAAQRRAWREMLGEQFTLEQPFNLKGFDLNQFKKKKSQ